MERKPVAKAPADPVVRCKCDRQLDNTPPHTCPYREEINGDSTTLCNCCADCRYECAMDV